ncbi:MAG: hypothetical protein KDM63_20980, partial [Verrucomicrobiae bacterium]|nr:hypothetical protein [Verrucomicrobiae bacterium]
MNQTSDPDSPASWTRRRFVRDTALISATLPWVRPAGAAGDDLPIHQATGTRVGEATDHSAIVWVRLTEHTERNRRGKVFPGKVNGKKPAAVDVPVADIEGACPGMAGRVRLRYGLTEDLANAIETPWIDVSEATDFIHQFHLEDLKPGSTYHYISETSGPGGEPHHGVFRGQFHTAPSPDAKGPVRFCVMTCQGYPD